MFGTVNMFAGSVLHPAKTASFSYAHVAIFQSPHFRLVDSVLFPIQAHKLPISDPPASYAVSDSLQLHDLTMGGRSLSPGSAPKDKNQPHHTSQSH
jgi:hypothetical protein